MTNTKEKLVKATCVCCGKVFWTTEEYQANVQAGNTESLCPECDADKEPLNMEDDNASEELEQELSNEPDPGSGLC